MKLRTKNIDMAKGGIISYDVWHEKGVEEAVKQAEKQEKERLRWEEKK